MTPAVLAHTRTGRVAVGQQDALEMRAHDAPGMVMPAIPGIDEGHLVVLAVLLAARFVFRD